MQGADADDDEIFFEADDYIEGNSPKKRMTKNTEFDFSEQNNNQNFERSIDRRETVYEDALDDLSKEYSGIKITEENPFRMSEKKTFDSSISAPFDLNEIEKKQKEKEKIRKSELLKDDLKEINLDLDFLKKNLKSIIPKCKGTKEKHLQMLYELQSFQADSQQIWAMRMSMDGRYIATGGKSGVLKIWEIFTEEESLDNYEYKGFLSYFKFMDENAFRIYTEHTQDIIDVCWNPTVKLK